jgi:hypothetical protein
MLNKLQHLQKVLESLTVTIDAMMPEAQRLMEQGKDHEFHKVTGMLEQIGAAESIVRDLIVVEVGDPNFGMFPREEVPDV